MLMFGLAGAATCLLVYAALHDFAARTVPNWLPAAIAVLGCLSRLADHSLPAGLLIAGVTFVVLFVIWLLGAMGGGDVKLWAATALLIPPHLQPELNFILRVVIIGGLLAVVYLALWAGHRALRARRLVRTSGPAGPAAGLVRRVLRVEAWRIARRGPLPYAFAIAGSAIMTLLPVHFQH